MSDSHTQETVIDGKAAVERTIEDRSTATVVVYRLKTHASSPIVVHLEEVIPPDDRIETLEFHPSHRPDDWTAGDERVHFDAVVSPKETRTVVLGIDAADDELLDDEGPSISESAIDEGDLPETSGAAHVTRDGKLGGGDEAAPGVLDLGPETVADGGDTAIDPDSDELPEMSEQKVETSDADGDSEELLDLPDPDPDDDDVLDLPDPNPDSDDDVLDLPDPNADGSDAAAGPAQPSDSDGFGLTGADEAEPAGGAGATGDTFDPETATADAAETSETASDAEAVDAPTDDEAGGGPPGEDAPGEGAPETPDGSQGIDTADGGGINAAAGESRDDETGLDDGAGRDDNSAADEEAPTEGESLTEGAEPPTADENSLVGELLTEIRAGQATEGELDELRAELGVARSDEVRFRHVQSRMDDFEAYVDALEELIDTHGTASEFVQGIERNVTQLRDELEAVRSDLSTVENGLEMADDERDGLTNRVAELEETVAGVDDELTELRALVETVDDRTDSLADELTAVREERADQLDSIEEDLSTKHERLEADLSAEIDSLREDVESFNEVRHTLLDAFGDGIEPTPDDADGGDER